MIAFALPEDRTAISGGTLYDREILRACARLAIPHRIWDGPAPADRAVLIDSVAWPRVPELAAAAGESTELHLLCHLLPSFPLTGAAKAAQEAAERQALRRLTGFVATSAFGARCLAPLANGRPVLVVPPALAIAGLAPPRLPRPDGFRGLLVGNRIACKGILPFLAALGTRVRDGDRFTLTLLGRDDLEPDHAARCRTLIAEHPLLRRAVAMRPPVEPAAMPRIYAEHSVAISAATFETYGMAMHEARAAGLPLLALAAGQARELVTEPAHGRIVADAEELAERCLAWIRDLAALRAAQDAAHANPWVSGWSWDAAANALRQLAPAK